jgi:hypothetical protein
MQTAGSAMHLGVPFSVYGESIIIFVQNCGIILLFWIYDKKIGLLQKLVVIAFFVAYAYALFVIPEKIEQYQWDIISSSNSILSK